MQTYLKMDSSSGETAAISCHEGSVRIVKCPEVTMKAKVRPFAREGWMESNYFLEGGNINSPFFLLGLK